MFTASFSIWYRRSYFPAFSEALIVERHDNGVDDAWSTVKTLCGQNCIDLVFLVSELGLLFLDAEVARLIFLFVRPNVEGVHK